MIYPILPGFINFTEAMRRVGSDARLLGLLVSGDLASWLVERDGTQHEVEKTLWASVDLRLVRETGTLSKGLVRGSPQIRLIDLQATGLDVWSRTIAGRREAKMRASDQVLETADTHIVPSNANKGGAPTKHDWDAMWIEIIWMMQEEEGLPATALELRKKMQQWFSDRFDGKQPADNTIAPKLDKLYERLGRKPQ